MSAKALSTMLLPEHPPTFCLFQTEEKLEEKGSGDKTQKYTEK